jgi:hypothetical protein
MTKSFEDGMPFRVVSANNLGINVLYTTCGPLTLALVIDRCGPKGRVLHAARCGPQNNDQIRKLINLTMSAPSPESESGVRSGDRRDVLELL